jgi:hypothetical protein
MPPYPVRVAHLPLETADGVDLLSILPNDLRIEEHLLKNAERDPQVAGRLRSLQAASGDRTLAYVVPLNYIMQGMIADTGPKWRLFQRHQTLAMISDYILNPIGHLRGGHVAPGGAMMHNSSDMERRIIFVEISGKQRLISPAADFGINEKRTPRFFVDIRLHTNQVVQDRDTPGDTGWGDVPTPMF